MGVATIGQIDSGRYSNYLYASDSRRSKRSGSLAFIGFGTCVLGRLAYIRVVCLGGGQYSQEYRILLLQVFMGGASGRRISSIIFYAFFYSRYSSVDAVSRSYGAIYSRFSLVRAIKSVGGSRSLASRIASSLRRLLSLYLYRDY